MPKTVFEEVDIFSDKNFPGGGIVASIAVVFFGIAKEDAVRALGTKLGAVGVRNMYKSQAIKNFGGDVVWAVCRKFAKMRRGLSWRE